MEILTLWTLIWHVTVVDRGRVGIGRVGMVLDLVAEFVMGRVCQGPSLSWAEFVMGRDVPESLRIVHSLYFLNKNV